MDYKNKKIILICGPSGSGKNTILSYVLKEVLEIEFYTTATSRDMREGEVDGVNYFFLTKEEFQKKIENDEFLEWEEVYDGVYYGTLKVELERIYQKGKVPISDLDVKGAVRIKDIYKENALLIFIKTPISVIKQRLIFRGTDSDEKIQIRLDRAEEEFSYEDKCDISILNINLEQSVPEVIQAIKSFLKK